MRAVRFKQVSARPSARVLLVLLALVTALTVPVDASAALAGGEATVQTASPGCGDEDDGPGGHVEPSAVRPASAEPGRPGSVRLPRTQLRDLVPVISSRLAAAPRVATPVPAAGRDGRAPGAGLLVTLRVSRT